MIPWWRILKKFPKWAITALIVLGSGLLFLVWLMCRQPAGKQPHHPGQSPPAARREAIVFGPEQVVLCGNTLVDFNNGKIIATQWLEGFANSAPPIVRVLPTEKLILCGQHGQAGAFGFDGRAKPPITFEGKPLGAAGYDFTHSSVVLVREGNLWQGRINWLASSIEDAKRVTNTGYFRADTFRGDWFRHDQTLFVPVLGRTHRISLDSGAVAQDQANIGQILHGISPDGKVTAVALGRGSFIIVDFASGEAKQLPIHGSFREFLWLDATRLAYASGQKEISIHDTATGQTAGPHVCPAIPLKLAAASPAGACLLIGTNQGPMIFNTTSGTFSRVDLPMEEGIWISETSLLCTNASTDTAVRGIWRVDANGTCERISSQPADLGGSGSGRPMITVSGGAVWISGGNLWRWDGIAVKQLTQDQHLIPSLQKITP